MGMQVVKDSQLGTGWFPVAYTTGSTPVTVYEGSVVRMGLATPADSGVSAMGTASGASNTSQLYVPLGIVIGTNDFATQYDSTYMGAKITSVNTQATLLARDWRGVEGNYSKNESQAMVQVALIGPSTLIKAPLFNTSYGTAPTAVSPTVAASTGLSMTTATFGFTPVAYNATHYCRTGTNAGLYRIPYNTSATAQTYYIPWPYDPTINVDTFVGANVRLGTCRAQFDAQSTFVDIAAALTSNYYLIDVVEVDLRTAGAETVTFRFNMDNFCAARA